MSHERWLVIWLTLTVIIILSLVSALTLSLGWSLLATLTSVFILLYPLSWLALLVYQFWCQSLMHLTTFTQTLKEGEHNLRFKRQNRNNLLLEVQQEIAALASINLQKNQQDKTLDSLLAQILDAWPIPVCLFDNALKLRYRNAAMNEQIQKPMLVGTSAQDLGFQLKNNILGHPNFNNNWQCQTVSYRYQEKIHWVFSALNVYERLQKNQSVTQQNLVRVLAHELRNSLTPMESMADTLLSAETLNEDQVRLVLSRIQKRSSRLLTFIGQYSQLNQLPPPKIKRFDLSDILEEAKTLAGKNCSVTFQGNTLCYGDAIQVSQMLINLIKNAQEACLEPICRIEIKAYYHEQNQVIEIIDNGPGFANFDNVLTPFYTTKDNGSGIGLSLCAEIAKNHGGQINLSNSQNSGANIQIKWPINSRASLIG